MGADYVSGLGSRGDLRLYRSCGGKCGCGSRVILHLPSHLPGSACARTAGCESRTGTLIVSARDGFLQEFSPLGRVKTPHRAEPMCVELQAALNPAGDNKIERFGWTFAPGDKVMQIAR